MPENGKPFALSESLKGIDPHGGVKILAGAVDDLSEAHDVNAHILVTNTLVLNFILRKLGISDAEVNKYLEETAKENIKRLPAGPEQAGAAATDSGHGPGLSPAADSGSPAGFDGPPQGVPTDESPNSDADASAGNPQTQQ